MLLYLKKWDSNYRNYIVSIRAIKSQNPFVMDYQFAATISTGSSLRQ
jgi:hypothetical protein